MLIASIVSIIGSLALVILELLHDGNSGSPSSESYDIAIAFFILFAKFGVSSLFAIVILANVIIFPTLFCSTAFGVCNVGARLCTIMAPLAAELPGIMPMAIFSGLTVLTILISRLVILDDTDDNMEK